MGEIISMSRVRTGAREARIRTAAGSVAVETGVAELAVRAVGVVLAVEALAGDFVTSARMAVALARHAGAEVRARLDTIVAERAFLKWFSSFDCALEWIQFFPTQT